MTVLLLIGMRGMGKSLLGASLACCLGSECEFIDLDVVLEQQEKCSVSEVVQSRGWDKFRDLESQILEKTLQNSLSQNKNFVIASGGGVVVKEQNRALIKSLDPKRVKVVQISCPLQDSIQYLAKNNSESRPNFSKSFEETFEERKEFYRECSSLEIYWEPLSKGDFEKESRDLISKLFVFKLSNDFSPNIVDMDYKPNLITSKSFLASIKEGNIIQDIDGIFVSSDSESKESIRKLRRESPLPLIFVVKCKVDADKVAFFKRHQIEYFLISQSLEHLFPKSSNVFHESEYPHLFNSQQHQQQDEENNLQRYFLFGNPISSSPSPTLHNTAFENSSSSNANDVKRKYFLCQTVDERLVKHIMTSQPKSFRGASVTIPFKEKVLPWMHSLSESAQKIMAVNTIIVQENGDLLGDNTDWIGIRNLIVKHYPSTEEQEGLCKKRALVVGAGGTSLAALYCLKIALGMEVTVYNRTAEKARVLAEKWDVQWCANISDIAQDVHIVVSTVPASSHFTFPEDMLKKNQLEVVVEVAYKPRETMLVKQCLQYRNVKVEVGVDMLIEQGLEQLKRWNVIKVDEDKVRQKAIQFYNNSNNINSNR